MSPLQHLASRAASALSQLAVREDKNCINEEGGDMCALPNAGTHTTPIVIGSIGGVLAIAIVAVLIHLHLRRQRMDAKEWTGKNVQELDDYGLSNGTSGPTKPKSTYQADVAHAKSEQPAAKSSIPSGARRSSQDSLRSLEMSLRQQHKPADMV